MGSHRARLPGNIRSSARSKEHSARLASAQVVMYSALRGFRECLAVREKLGRHPTSAEPPTVGNDGKSEFEGHCRKIPIAATLPIVDRQASVRYAPAPFPCPRYQSTV